MAPTRDELNDTHGPFPEDELGRLVRWSLEDSVLAAEPSPDTWPKILARVRAIDAPQRVRRWTKRPLVPLASVLQAVVISGLLLVFGLEVNRDVVAPHTRKTTRSTPIIRRASVSQHYPEDVLRGCILAREAREVPSPRAGRIPEV